MLLKGLDDNGNHWTEVKYKGLLYGYFNFTPRKKLLFDSALQSIKYKY